MKKLFIAVLGFAVAGMVTAQSYLELSPNPSTFTGTTSDIALLEAEIINNGPESQEFLWRRLVNDLPEGWFSYVCDPNLCYSPTQDEPAMSFVLTGDNNKLKVTFSPNGNAGTGYSEIEIYSTTDSANYYVLGAFTADLTATGFFSPNADNTLTVYPNPANQVINAMASYSSEVKAVTIINIVGKEVLYTVWNTGDGRMTLDVSHLPEGIYFVQFLGEGNSILSTKKIAVKH